ncbi:MAG TPA: hypothetical protein VHA56_13860 [Mucilaginibacter sp.]|nr:hypothetical protein [Mucilaginibacter sp.]
MPKPHVSDEKIEILLIAIKELRRVHSHISNAYDQLRIKALAMIAGEVAIVSFIFASDGANDHFQIPHSPAGRIFLSIGVAFVSLAFGLLVTSITSGLWPVPGDMDEIEQIDNGIDNRYDSIEKFLKFLRKDYLEANRLCMKIVATKAKRVNWGLYLLLAGVIILMVIKLGGPHQ